MDPFSIAPYEMWDAILDRLEDPQDKLYLVRANSTLENAFRSKIALWQLLAVLPILASHNLDLQNRRLDSAIRKCRRISQECCKAVDKLIDIHWEKFNELPRFANCRYELEYSDDFQRFWRKAQNHPPHRSPLLGKSLESSFSFANDEEDDDDDMNDEDRVILIRLLRDFIAKFGRNLKRIFLDVDFEETGFIHSYRFLADLLTQTPNIESLMLDIPSVYIDEEIVLPPLVSLQRLDIIISCIALALPDQGHSLNFQEYFPQLTQLRFSFDFWKEQYNTKGLFPKLKSIRLYTYRRLVGTEEKVYKFYKNLDAPKLEELRLDYLGYYPGHSTKEFENSVYFLKMTGLIFLRNLHPKCKWTTSERGQYCFVTILFNRNVNSVSFSQK